MLFSSVIFLFGFLPIVLILHLVAPKVLRNGVLLLCSLFFYAWGELHMSFIMLLSIALNYLFGILIDSFERRKLMLWIGVILNLGLLMYYKYFNFILDTLLLELDPLGIKAYNPFVHLPIGISFFTFQGISYITDVYRKQAKAEFNPINIGLYISLFPQLIAGPIVRYNTIMDQIRTRVLSWNNLIKGSQRFIIGLAKKVIVANTMAVVANGIISSEVSSLNSLTAWVGILAYAIQIYFDFSGYSDMAIGLGNMFGFKFEENFNYPYVSKSIREFWRRWHISLSTWFRDYLYIPLGGSRKGVSRTYLNLFIVFLLTGFWHGPSWNFVIWGLIHGVFIVLERVGFSKILSKVPSIFQHLYCLFIVVVSWVFFKIEDLSHALDYLEVMFGLANGEQGVLTWNGFNFYQLLVGVLAIIFSVNTYGKLSKMRFALQPQKRYVHEIKDAIVWCFLGLIFFYTASELANGTYNPFIYFRF